MKEELEFYEAAEGLTVEEEEYLREYKEDLSAIKPEENKERIPLIQRIFEGDILAKGRLIELYLPEVLRMAIQLHIKSIFLGDMVQEGNIALLRAVDTLNTTENAHEMICKAIRQGILELIEAENEEKQRDERMLEKVRRLEEAIRTLTEDSAEEISVEELSAYLEMSREEIEDTLRLTGGEK